MKLDELELLNQSRTQGLWLSYCDEGPIHYPAPDGKGWTHSICIGDEGKDQNVPHTCIGTVLAKDEIQARIDSDAIAAAMNSLGPLLRIARAAERWSSLGSTKDREAEIELASAVDALLYGTTP